MTALLRMQLKNKILKYLNYHYFITPRFHYSMAEPMRDLLKHMFLRQNTEIWKYIPHVSL